MQISSILILCSVGFSQAVDHVQHVIHENPALPPACLAVVSKCDMPDMSEGQSGTYSVIMDSVTGQMDKICRSSYELDKFSDQMRCFLAAMDSEQCEPGESVRPVLEMLDVDRLRLAVSYLCQHKKAIQSLLVCTTSQMKPTDPQHPAKDSDDIVRFQQCSEQAGTVVYRDMGGDVGMEKHGVTQLICRSALAVIQCFNSSTLHHCPAADLAVARTLFTKALPPDCDIYASSADKPPISYYLLAGVILVLAVSALI